MQQDEKLAIFLKSQAKLKALSYRMLGSIAEAEELVQDVYITWHERDITTIQNHEAWLVRVCINRCLDYREKAQKIRETYPGTWLPEPALDSFTEWNIMESQESPEKRVSFKESTSIAFLLLLERLSAIERAIFLLREIFEYSYTEISLMVDRTTASCRKIAERSRKAILDNKPRFDSDEVKLTVLKNFYDTLMKGDVDQLRLLLADDAEFWSDGGGKVSAVPYVMTNPLHITKFLIKIFASSNENFQWRTEMTKVNGSLGIIVSTREKGGFWTLATVFSMESIEGKVAKIYGIRNPDKLKLTAEKCDEEMF